MKKFFGTHLGFGLVGAGILSWSVAQAQIHFHAETDPLPLVEVMVVLPMGFDPDQASQSGLGQVWGDIFEGGTAQQNRESYLAALGRMGAQSQFQFGMFESTWSFRFPLPTRDQDRQQLVNLLSEVWRKPRWTNENFGVAKNQLEAALRASLDSDMSLGMATLRRWMGARWFGAHPLFAEDLKGVTLERSRALFEERMKSLKSLWVGYVGPESGDSLVVDILKESFPSLNELRRQPGAFVLNPSRASQSLVRVAPVAVIVDKPERNQVVMSMLALSPRPFNFEQELSFRFGQNLAIESGLSSIFGHEIRTARGLAYSVGGGVTRFRGLTGFSIVANPKAERADEALKVFSDLVASTYGTATRIGLLKQNDWDRQWKSFKYSRVLGRATPSARLAEWSDVVSGDLSVEFFGSDSSKWKLNRSQVQKELESRFADAAYAYSFVGDAKLIEPLVKRYFPSLEILVIPYRAALSRKTFVPQP